MPTAPPSRSTRASTPLTGPGLSFQAQDSAQLLNPRSLSLGERRRTQIRTGVDFDDEVLQVLQFLVAQAREVPGGSV